LMNSINVQYLNFGVTLGWRRPQLVSSP
jgi:hypothetical protein